MTLVSLDDQPCHIPSLDDWRLGHILVMQIESFDSMKDIDYLTLLFWLYLLPSTHLVLTYSWVGVRLVVHRWPIFKLECLTIWEKADDATPVLLRESVHGVVYLECNVGAITVAANPFLKHLLRLILLIIRLNYLVRWFIPSVPQKFYCIFKTNITCLFRCWNDDNRPWMVTATTIMLFVISLTLFENFI